jgi:high-affinity iron transporter
VAWAVVHYGARLPVARFQAITSALLLAMALVFVGHGISALQEAGVVPVTTLGSLALPLLGVHPTAQGLGAQLLVMLLIAVGIVLHHRDGRR